MKPRLTVSSALKRWWILRSQGVPAGSHNREMAILRAYLIAVGRWREVYDLTA